jgi:hypothetical protein
MKGMKSRLSFVLYLLLGASACETEDATFAVVDDDYIAPPDGAAYAGVTVYKVWWSTALFDAPLGPGEESSSQRVVTSDETAYALLAPGWNPSSGAPPTQLVPVRSKTTLSVKRGDTLHVRVSDITMTGNCGAGQPLSQDDADFITQRIFPGDFAGGTYDASACIFVPNAIDAGAD